MFDPENRVTTFGSVQTHGYDAAGRETRLTNPNNETTQWGYYDNNTLQTQTLPNGVTTPYNYNARYQVYDQQTRTANGTLLAEFGNAAPQTTMTYDGMGNRTRLTANFPSSPAPYSGTTSYAYDQRNQLTQEQSSRGSNYTIGFTYDGGNSTGPGNPTTMRGFGHGYNADNQDTANSYDGNGNPYNYHGTSLWFDPENRLTQYGSAVVNSYNGDGLRAKKTYNGGSGYNWFVYDGDEPVCEIDGSGNVAALHTFGVNGLISRRCNGVTGFYVFDPSGNGALLLDSNGNVATASVSDSFGNTVSTGGNVYSAFLGQGGQWGYYQDAEDGLTLLGHRFL